MASKSQLGNVLLLACSGIWRFCWAKQSMLAATKRIKYPAREPLLMAFVMSLQATLWRSVIIQKWNYLWHPKTIWRALSACWQSGHWRLLVVDTSSGLVKADSMFLFKIGTSAVARYCASFGGKDWTCSKMSCLHLCGHVEATLVITMIPCFCVGITQSMVRVHERF